MLCAKLPKCDKNLRCIEVDRNLLEDTIMTVPIFVDLEGFRIKRDFVVKEFAALKEGHVLSNTIFMYTTIFLSVPIHGIFFQNQKDTRRYGRLRIIIEYNGRMEWFHTRWPKL